MKKLTAAQAYAAQVKADRRAAALDRQVPAIKAEEARVRGIYDAVAALDVTSDGRRRVARDGSSNENKRGPVAKVTHLAGGLKASLASEKGARTARANRLAAKAG
jgi:hypothetical protein